MGKTGIFAVMSVSINSRPRRPIRPGRRAANHPKCPTRFLWKRGSYCTQGLISETNVFNLTDQDMVIYARPARIAGLTEDRARP